MAHRLVVAGLRAVASGSRGAGGCGGGRGAVWRGSGSRARASTRSGRRTVGRGSGRRRRGHSSWGRASGTGGAAGRGLGSGKGLEARVGGLVHARRWGGGTASGTSGAARGLSRTSARRGAASRIVRRGRAWRDDSVATVAAAARWRAWGSSHSDSLGGQSDGDSLCAVARGAAGALRTN